MRTILLLAPGEATEPWLGPPYAALFDEVRRGDAPTLSPGEGWRGEPAPAVLCGDYDVVLDGEAQGEPPAVREGLGVAVLCRSLDALAYWRGQACTADLVFRPSRLARLDALAVTRPTLRLARAVRAGEPVTSAVLDEERGGRGVSAALRQALIGRPLAYDLPAGAALDFGMVLAT